MHSGFHFCANLRRGSIFLLIAVLVSSSAAAGDSPSKIDFPHAVVPILKAHCVECHGGRRHEGDFTINTREEILKAGAVEPGKSADSHLIDLVTSTDKEERMPKGKPALSAAEVKTLRDWIDQGMPGEAGFTFALKEYEPPLKPRRPELPPAVAGGENAGDWILGAFFDKNY